MSIYRFLSMPVPTIAYCALHQAAPGVSRDEYVETMREFHERIHRESSALLARYDNFLGETVDRELHTLRASITEFLQTPLRPDEDEVRRRIQESLGRMSDHLAGGVRPGLIRSAEGEILDHASGDGIENMILLAGLEYLKGLGFTTAKGRQALFESAFVVRGGQSLDVLEHLVRDVLGIYSTTHGKHIREFDNYAYAAYNLVHEQGDPPVDSQVHRPFEFSLFFSKPEPEVIKYAPFRSGLTHAMDALVKEIQIRHVSLWQRKLGLGAGVEFVLRFVSTEAEQLVAIVRFLNALDEKTTLREVLVGRGKLLVKRLLF